MTTDYNAHKWDRDGERCTVCGDKDWMGGDCSGPRNAPMHVGESSFEAWYAAHGEIKSTIKQLARDAYAAGMSDPLVLRAHSTPHAASEPESAEQQVEAMAAEIYSGWFALPGYVPWVEGGNSERQDDARRMARVVVHRKAELSRLVELSQQVGMTL